MAGGSSTTSLLYSKVVESINNKIKDGSLKYGERLQTEKWLCDKYNISRTTLRKAIDELIALGLVERRTNKGIYVTYSKFDSCFDKPTSLFRELQQTGIIPSSKILSFRRMSAAQMQAKELHCPIGEELLVIERIRYANGVPSALQTQYLIQRFFPQFNPWLLVDTSFHDIMKNNYNMEIAISKQVVNACFPTKEVSNILEIPVRTPLLFTKSTITLETGDIVTYQNSYINTNIIPYAYRYNHYVW